MIILFDLDGTLIDSTDAILESFHNSFDIHSHPHPSDTDIKSLIGHPLDVMYKELGVDESLVWDFVKTYKEYYGVIATQKTYLLDKAQESVLLANSFAELGIVTTKTGKYSQAIMEHFGIMSYFKVLIGREHVQNPKPHGEPILKALEHFESEGKEIWMIGDTRMDLISAKNAGVNSIGVLSGYEGYETLKEYTNLIFDNALDAVNYLKTKV